jgi:hypothetical protein
MRRVFAAGGTPSAIVAWVFGILVALTLGHFLLGLPIQFSEVFGNMQKLSTPWRELLTNEFTQTAYVRPFLWATLKLVYDLSGGQYTLWFRTFHALQVVLLVVLYLALVRPRTWQDVATLPIGLAVLFGLHTFTGTVREAFPINTFMTVLILCFAAGVIALGRYRPWHDVAAVLLFVVAALTVESGLLVGVIVLGAALVGGRGVSRLGLGVVTALFAGYFVLRFAVLDTGGPGLSERSSGFGFAILEPSQLIERFGSDPSWFYAYNVVASAISVLFSEPSGGVFHLTRAVVLGDLERYMLVPVISSAAVAMTLGLFAWRRRAAWWSRQFERDDQLVLLFVMVLCANAAISYPYTKDVIMSPAGAFLAVAAFVAWRNTLGSLRAYASPLRAAVTIVVCLLVGTTWADRVLGMYTTLREATFVERNDWAFVESTLEKGGTSLDPAARALLNTLRDDALFIDPPPPPLDLPSVRRLEDD